MTMTYYFTKEFLDAMCDGTVDKSEVPADVLEAYEFGNFIIIDEAPE